MASMNELLRNMSQLETELSRFETRFGVRSRDFYTAMMQGELEEFDALDEYRMDFIEWLAIYKTWLTLQRNFAQAVEASEPLLAVRQVGCVISPLPIGQHIQHPLSVELALGQNTTQ